MDGKDYSDIDRALKLVGDRVIAVEKFWHPARGMYCYLATTERGFEFMLDFRLNKIGVGYDK